MENRIGNLFHLHKILIIVLISFVFLIIFSSSVSAEDYIIQGEEIIFNEETGLITFEGSPVFKSEDFVIKADKFEVDTDKQLITAFNNVIIESDKDDLRGESLEYNYGKETGSLYGADGSIGEIYFSGSKLDVLSTSPVRGVLQEAEFTPCSRKDPHYHFKAKEIRINSDNTLTIHDIVPYIGDIPVFYLPYYTVTYDPEGKEGEELQDSFPMPQLGYDTEQGVTVEFSYPYQIGESISGNIYYWKAGRGIERDETREFTNNLRLAESLTFKNRYYYLHDYDFEDEHLEEEEEEFRTSLLYTPGRMRLETGLIKDLLPEEAVDRYFIDADYSFRNGLNTGLYKKYDPEAGEFIKTVYTANYSFKTGVNSSLRREYDSSDLIKEKYNLSYSQAPVKWNLKYIDGEDYNYYPYLDLTFPAFYSFKSAIGFGRVENGGVELNKYRLNLDYNNSWQLPANFTYHLSHKYRLDHYQSDYDQNYHFSVLNTGLSYQNDLSKKLYLQTSIFYRQDSILGESPLVDDREEEERLIKPSLSIDLKGDYPDSAWAIESDGSYDLNSEEWDQINLRLRKKEDCFDLFLGYEVIEDRYSFGLEL